MVGGRLAILRSTTPRPRRVASTSAPILAFRVPLAGQPCPAITKLRRVLISPLIPDEVSGPCPAIQIPLADSPAGLTRITIARYRVGLARAPPAAAEVPVIRTSPTNWLATRPGTARISAPSPSQVTVPPL